MAKVNKRALNLQVTRLDLLQVNQALRAIEQEISNLRGTGQNVELHGGQLSGVKPADGTGQALTAAPGNNGLDLTNQGVKVKCGAGLELTPAGVAIADTTGQAYTPAYAVGMVVITTEAAWDPNNVYEGQTWERFAKGRVLVGVDEDDSDFDEPEETGGSKQIDITHDHEFDHTHPSGTSTIDGDGTHGNTVVNDGAYVSATSGYTSVPKDVSTHATISNLDSMNPYVAVYFWRRLN